MSPGWQSNALQMASSVENRMALALPFLRMERLAMVMPTRSESSVTLILRFAIMTSRLTTRLTSAASYGEIVFRLQVDGLLQGALEDGHGGRHDDSHERD